ncbi:MAG: Mur ligase family protein [Pirellula sp.]
MDRYPSSISLKSLFPNAKFIGSDDIRCTACDQHPDSHLENWVFAAGMNPWASPEQEVLQAQAHGAVGILTEQYLPTCVPQCIVPCVQDALGKLAMQIAGEPCHKTLTIGVVGTHGKTTASLLIASMLKKIGKSVAYHTSLGAATGQQTGLVAEASADALTLTQWLKQCVCDKAPAAILELSDEMLQSHATAGIQFDVLVFTSLRRTQRCDSLQARGIENAMGRLLGQLKEHGVVVCNADDARLNRWANRSCPTAIRYGLDADADVQARRLPSLPGEQSMILSVGNSVAPLTSTILGDHNARHMLCAVAVGYSLGLELYETVCGVERLQRIPGRMQRVPVDHDVQVIVDGADQPDRLAVALHSISRNGTPVTCVAEVPDAATPEQLAAYGRVLERSASYVILTQSRRSIRFGQKAVWQVLDGCEYPAAVQVVPNRRAAIELAIRSSRPGEAILLAGWGADRWTNDQTKESRCDLDVATELLREFANESPCKTIAMQAPMQQAPMLQNPALRIYRGKAG